MGTVRLGTRIKKTSTTDAQNPIIKNKMGPNKTKLVKTQADKNMQHGLHGSNALNMRQQTSIYTMYNAL